MRSSEATKYTSQPPQLTPSRRPFFDIAAARREGRQLLDFALLRQPISFPLRLSDVDLFH